MSAEETKDLKEFFKEHFSHLEEKVDKISRGMYGDKENNYKGLIDRQQHDEQRLDKLEGIVKAAKWIWTAISVSVVLAWEVFGDHVKGLFK